MLAAQTIAIDLPHRGLVWCDASGQTWLAYNDPNWIAQRHGITGKADQILRAMSEVLDEIAAEATKA